MASTAARRPAFLRSYREARELVIGSRLLEWLDDGTDSHGETYLEFVAG